MANERILLTGRIIAGAETEWNIAPLPEVEPLDGELQRLIDDANAQELAEEWQDYFLEQEWLDHQL